MIERLYDAEVGRNPGVTGVDVTFQIATTSGKFAQIGISVGVPKRAPTKCFDENLDKACVVVRVPGVPLSPAQDGADEL